MISFRISKCPLTKKCGNSESYVVNMSGDLESRLNDSKESQDPYYEGDKRFSNAVREFDVFATAKFRIRDRSNAQNVTNAWLKMYEILCFYDMESLARDNRLRHFDNAAFPGSFILAANHFAKTRAKVSNYEWFGSSWLNIDGSVVLDDTYELYKNNPENWLMNSEYDGDVNKPKNQKYWKSKLGQTIDLYTSDLGFSTGEGGDYAKQEYSHVQPNLGQILAGINVVRKGGNIVTKQYTYFNTLNISLYAILTNLFESVYISKPITSRPTNSETYVVCRNFLGPFDDGSLEDYLIKLIINKNANFSFSPLVTKSSFDEMFLSTIKRSLVHLCERQIKYVGKRLDFYDKISGNPSDTQKAYKAVSEHKAKVLKRWETKNRVYKLADCDKIPGVKVIGNRKKYNDKKRKHRRRKRP